MTIAPGQTARAEDVVALLASTGLSPTVDGVLQIATVQGNVGTATPAIPGAGFIEVALNGASALIAAYTPAQLGATVSGGGGNTTVVGGGSGTVVPPPNAGSIGLNVPATQVAGTQLVLSGTFAYTSGTLSALQVLVDNTLLTGLVAQVSGPTYHVTIATPTGGNHTVSVIDANNTAISSPKVPFVSTAPVVPAGVYQPASFNAATMRGQDFTLVPVGTGKSGIDTSVFTNVFTDSDTPSVGFYFAGPPDGLWITSSNNSLAVANEYGKWSQSGFEQNYTGKSSGFGYGTFHFRARSGQRTQGPGINLILWRADGLWLDPSCGNQYTEIDVAEAWGFNGTSTCTLHWYDPSSPGNNGQVFHPLTFPNGSDNTTLHDYDLIWQAGSLALYIDGVQQFNDTSSHVPVDFAHGDCNRTLGAQVVIQTSQETLPTIQLMLPNMWWSPSVTPPSSASTIVVAPAGVLTTLSLSYPNGVNFTTGNPVQVLITAANGAAAAGVLVYWAMWNAGQTSDTYSSHPVSLGAGGTATISVQPVNNGDYIQVVGSTTTLMPVASGSQLFVLGAAIAPTVPTVTGLTLSWTAGSSRVGAGPLSVTVTANNGAAAAGATVWGAVFNGYNAYSNFSANPVVLNAQGVGTLVMNFSQTGDYPEFTASLSNPGAVYAYLGLVTIN